MLKYWLFKLASVVLPRLPVAVSYGGAWLAAELAYRFAASPRRVVEANLRHVLPEASDRELARTARGVFHTAAYNYVDMFLIPSIPPDVLAQRVELHNGGTFFDACHEGKGVIIATAHFGNFDLLVQVSAAYKLPATVIMEPLHPAPLHRLVLELRSSHGLRLLSVGPPALREVVRTLKSGGVLAIAGDRDIQRRGRPVSFFGQETTLPVGAVELAMRTGAQLLPAYGLRLPGRRYQILVERPLPLITEEQRPDAVDYNLRLLAASMERMIRQHPEQWIVFEPFWKGASAEPAGAQSPEQESMGAHT